MKIYDCSEVTAAFFAFLVDSGFGEGTFLKITHESPRRTHKEGADGEIVISKTNSRLATCEVTLMQTSEANSKFAAMAEVDQKLPNGAGVGPFMIKDRSGTALMSGNCWIEKVPDPEYAKEATERMWTLGLEIEFEFAGGS